MFCLPFLKVFVYQMTSLMYPFFTVSNVMVQLFSFKSDVLIQVYLYIYSFYKNMFCSSWMLYNRFTV